MTFEHLSDDALVAALHACVADSRGNDARMILYLIEVDKRRLYLARACTSLYDFCKRRLGLSDGQAYRRIATVRLVKDYPFILPLLLRGVTTMSTLTQIRRYVTPRNVHELIADTAGKNRFEIDAILAKRFGFEPTPSPRNAIFPDAELEALIQRAFELECHSVPDGDRLKLAKRAFRALIADGEKKRRAKTLRPRPPAKAQGSTDTPTETATKGISRAATREMFEAHGEQCSYVDPTTGERCESRVFIQRNHRIMKALGGTSEAENLEPLCGPHNRYLAEVILGRERINRAINLRQRRLTDDDEDGGDPDPDPDT